MGRPTTMQKVLGGLLIGGMLLGGGSLALASNDNPAGSQSGATQRFCGSEMQGDRGAVNGAGMQTVLDDLVSAGTLTAAQTEQIQSNTQQMGSERQAQRGKMQGLTQEERQTYFEQNGPAKQDRLSALVSAGTLTQEQADAIHTAMQNKRQEQRQEQLNTALNTLVEKGSLNIDQSNTILNKLAEVQNTRQQEMAGQLNLTPEERQAQMQANRPGQVNPLAELVTDGTLTQTQADEVQQALGHSGGRQCMNNGDGPR